MSLNQFLPIKVQNLTTGTSTLLIGGSKMFKTTLLFQASVTAASEGEKVIFIRPEPLKALPCHVHGLPKPVPSATQHIKLVYLKTGQDLKNYLCKIHMDTHALPGFLIVDDLNFYTHEHLSKHTNSTFEQIAAAFSALIKDAADFCTKKRGSTCNYLVSNTIQSSVKSNGTFFYDQIWTIVNKPHPEYDKMWVMHSHKPKNVSVTFYLTKEDEIFLHEVKTSIEQTSVECKPGTSNTVND